MVNIDKEKCIGCGACAASCPEGFEISEGKAHVKDSKAKCIKQGIEVCPVNAIRE